MSVKQLEARLIGILKRRNGSIQAQNVLECHLALLLKLRTTGPSLAIIKSLLDKMSKEGKIVIGWNGNVRRSVTLVKQNAEPVMSEVMESEKEEVYVQEVMVSEVEEAAVQQEAMPVVATPKTAELPEYELLTLAVLECRKVSDDDDLVKASIVNLLQESLGCTPKMARRWVSLLKDLGLLVKITGGRRPVWRIDNKVDEVTPGMLAALSTSAPKKGRVSTAQRPQPTSTQVQSKAEAAKVEDVATDTGLATSATSRIEALLGAALEEIRRLRALEEQYNNGLEELENLRTENGKLKAGLEALDRFGDDLEKMLQLDPVH